MYTHVVAYMYIHMHVHTWGRLHTCRNSIYCGNGLHIHLGYVSVIHVASSNTDVLELFDPNVEFTFGKLCTVHVYLFNFLL